MRQLELHCLHLLLSPVSTKYPSPHIPQVELLADTKLPPEHVRQFEAELTQVAQLGSHRVHLLLLLESTNRPAWVQGVQVGFSKKRVFPVGHVRQLVADPEHVAQLGSQLLQLDPDVKLAAGEPQDPQILVVVFRYVPAKQVSQVVDVPEQVLQLESQG